jgi:hypothetical protein
MHHRTGAMVAAALLLTSCASMIDKPLASMVGQPIDAAISRFGFPTEEKTIAGHKVYRWVRNRSLQGNAMSCELNYEVDGAGTITRYSWEGQLAACQF